MNKATRITPVLGLILLLAACSSPAPTPTPTPSPSTKGNLEVVIGGLPSGVAANVEISGPDGFSQTIAASTVLKNLKSGAYNFKLNPVTPDSATFSDNGSPTSLNFDSTAGGSVEVKYSCSVVKPPDAGLDQLLATVTEKAQYNCSDLAKLTSLKATGRNISNLEGIQYATGLINLSLVQNNISSLPAGIFDQLTNLKGLFLNQNTISSLPTGIFDKLINLTDLSLAENNIISISAGIFDKLTNLTDLGLDTNNISSLPAGIFDQLTNLKGLDLGTNKINSLPPGIFDKLTNVASLALSRNDISSLPSGIFDKLTNLTGLGLAENNISSLPPGIFDKLTSLSSLTLSRNKISSLPAGSFAKLTKLQSLKLASNKLVSLPDDFANLGELQSLSLFDNFLTTLPGSLMSKLPNLSSLNIGGNCLILNQEPLKTQLASVKVLSDDNNPKPGCPQKSITLSSIQAKVLTQNNQALNSETMSFKVKVDGVLQNVGAGVSVKKGLTVTENLSFFVQQSLEVEVFAGGSRLGNANLVIDANYTSGPASFPLVSNGAIYVVNVSKN